jgi:hypothetical protein
VQLKVVGYEEALDKLLCKCKIERIKPACEELKDLKDYYKESAFNLGRRLCDLVKGHANSIFIYGSVARGEAIVASRMLERRYMHDNKLVKLVLQQPEDKKLIYPDIDLCIVTENEIFEFSGLEDTLKEYSTKYPNVYYTLRVFKKQKVIEDISDIKQPKFFRRLFLFSPLIVLHDDGFIIQMERLAYQIFKKRGLLGNLDLQYELDHTLFKYLQRRMAREGILSIEMDTNLIMEAFPTILLECNGEIDGRIPRADSILLRVPRRNRRVEVITL